MTLLRHLVLCLLLLASLSRARAGEVIDRIVAVVNRGVVLQSDLDVAVRYQALLEGKSLRSVNALDLGSALDRLIDQQLLFEEMGDASSFSPTDQEASKRVTDIRAQFPEAVSDEAWFALLQRYGISEEILQDRIRTQIEILRFVDLRLRPNVQIEDADVDTYYRQEFLPRLSEAGGAKVPLERVSGRIRQLLIERRIDELLSSWLHNLREQSHIEIHLEGIPEANYPSAHAASKSNRSAANQ